MNRTARMTLFAVSVVALAIVSGILIRQHPPRAAPPPAAHAVADKW
jgi:hypothetical protein